MRRLIKRLRTNWNFTLQVLLVNVWIFAFVLPGWSQSLQAKQIVVYSPHAIAYIFAVLGIIVLVPVGIVFWRRVALQSASCDPTATWFSYAKTLNWSKWGI